MGGECALPDTALAAQDEDDVLHLSQSGLDLREICADAMNKTTPLTLTHLQNKTYLDQGPWALSCTPADWGTQHRRMHSRRHRFRSRDMRGARYLRRRTCWTLGIWTWGLRLFCN